VLIAGAMAAAAAAGVWGNVRAVGGGAAEGASTAPTVPSSSSSPSLSSSSPSPSLSSSSPSLSSSSVSGDLARPVLVIHAGPHKTGTTSLQGFLVRHGRWLSDKHGVFAALPWADEEGGTESGKAAQHAKWNAHLANTEIARWNGDARQPGNPNFQGRASREIAHDTRAVLRRWAASPGVRAAVVSAEDLSLLAEDGWAALAEEWGGMYDVRVVVVHRQAVDRLRSVWFQTQRRSTEPVDFLAFMAMPRVDPDPRDPDFDAGLVERAERAGMNVLGVSYERVKALGGGTGVTSFVVCNASLSLEGDAWKACEASIRARLELDAGLGGAVDIAFKNASPPETSIPLVLRLREVWERERFLGRRTCTESFKITATNARVDALAASLPTQCVDVGKLYEDADRAFFERTHALPVANTGDGAPQRICLLGELRRPQLEAIEGLLVGLGLCRDVHDS